MPAWSPNAGRRSGSWLLPPPWGQRPPGPPQPGWAARCHIHGRRQLRGAAVFLRRRASRVFAGEVSCQEPRIRKGFADLGASWPARSICLPRRACRATRRAVSVWRQLKCDLGESERCPHGSGCPKERHHPTSAVAVNQAGAAPASCFVQPLRLLSSDKADHLKSPCMVFAVLKFQ